MYSARMREQIDYLKSLEKRPPFSYLLDFQESAVTIGKVFGHMPLGSCLALETGTFVGKCSFIINFKTKKAKQRVMIFQ